MDIRKKEDNIAGFHIVISYYNIPFLDILVGKIRIIEGKTSSMSFLIVKGVFKGETE